MDDEQQWLEQMVARCRGLLKLTADARLTALLTDVIRNMEERLAKIRAGAKH
jgi:hypothetical protein